MYNWLDYFLYVQAGDLSPICFDLPQFSHRSKNRHKKTTQSIQTQTFELVFCFAFACTAISCHAFSCAAFSRPPSGTEPFRSPLLVSGTSALSMLVFRSRLKTRLFTISYYPSPLTCTVAVQWILDTLIAHVTYLLTTWGRSCVIRVGPTSHAKTQCWSSHVWQDRKMNVTKSGSRRQHAILSLPVDSVSKLIGTLICFTFTSFGYLLAWPLSFAVVMRLLCVCQAGRQVFNRIQPQLSVHRN